MRPFLAACQLQLRLSARIPDDLMVLATVPLYTVMFLWMVKYAGRLDLLGYALLAPVLIALWAMALFVSGEIVERDRAAQVLESLLVTSTAFPLVVFARITTVTVCGLGAFLEVLVVSRLVFGVTLSIRHPGVFFLTLAATTLAMAGTALIMSAIFVLQRGARIFQNSLSYPFYVLGGVLVPTAYLPSWLRPITQVVFLSWASDLLRDSLLSRPVGAVPFRVGMILGLGVGSLVLGWLLLNRLVTRARGLGTVAMA